MALNIHDQATLERIIGDWKLTPATFAHKISHGTWIPSPHLLYVSKLIANGIAKGNARIIISAPPRHGKSQLIDIYTPAWILEVFDRYSVILASYGADLSETFGRQCRDLIIGNPNLLDARVRSDASRVSMFATEAGGSMTSVGLGGAITGRGANVLLIDDYIKEVKEALSPTYREYVWNWFITTAYTRLEPNGSVIIIATRWHSDDLIGRILTNFPGQWQNIVLPAEALENDLLGRKVGEPLFPERYPLPVLQERKEILGSVWYAALFQQQPIDEAKKISDGNWLKMAQVLPTDRHLTRIRMWDLAATEGGGDYTTGSLCSYDRLTSNFFIENVIRRQLSPQQVELLVRNAAVNDGTDVEVGIEQEPGSSGKALVEHYQRNVLPEFKVTPFPVAGKNSKLLRAQPLLAAAEASRVVLLEGPWNNAYIREFDLFPGGPYDDQVDTTAAGYTKLSGKKIFTASWGRRPPQNRVGNKAIKSATMRIGNSRGASWGRRRIS